MLPKKGNTFPSRQDYASGLAAALSDELGSTRQAVKTLMRWTNANERTAKNWLSGRTGPRGEYLARLIHHSDAALVTFLAMGARDGIVIAVTLPAIRMELLNALAAVDRCLTSSSR